MAVRAKQLENLAAREKAVAQGRFTFLVACAVIAASLFLCVYIWQYTRMVEVQNSISKLEGEMRQMREKAEHMRLQRERLARLERVEFAAEERLHMIVPNGRNIRYLPVAAKTVRRP